MTDPQVTVLDRHQPGARSYLEVLQLLHAGEPLACLGKQCALSEALEGEWSDDRHFVGYVAVDGEGNEAPLRICKRRSTFLPELLADGGQLLVRVLAFDHDLHDDKGIKREWTDGDSGLVQRIGEGNVPYLPTYWYTTKHGSRFVYVLTEPVAPEVAEALCVGVMRDFAEAGIELDPSCKDWTREFRLPKTVRGDGGAWYRESEHFMLVPFGELLDPSTVAPGQSKATGTYAAVSLEFGEKPDEGECRAILYVPGSQGRERMSDWHKRAKRQLGGSIAYPLCFEDGKLDAEFIAKHGQPGRNETLSRIVGSLCGLLVAFDDTTEEHVYALLRPVLEQLTVDCPEGEDWTETGWGIVCRHWEGEVQQLAAQRQEARQAEVRTAELEGILLDAQRDQYGDELPEDADEQREWMRHRLIVQAPRGLYVMGTDGDYSRKPVTLDQLHGEIRRLGMADVIPTRELRGQAWAHRNPRDMTYEHGLVVHEVRSRVGLQRPVIERIDKSGALALVLPLQPLADLVPEFDADVDAYLGAIGGAHPETLRDYLAGAVEVSRPTCGLVLFGPPGTGKSMIGAAIAECFEVPQAVDGEGAFGQFNAKMLDNPVVHFDEGIPRSSHGRRPAELIRSLVSGGTMRFERKGLDAIYATAYPRVVVTANDASVLRALTDANLGVHDRQAIEDRFVVIRVPDSAGTYLRDRGNYAHTGGWVAGEGRPSRFVFAKHILWLHETRIGRLRSAGTRFLVRGTGGVLDSYVYDDPKIIAFVECVCRLLVQPGENAVRVGPGENAAPGLYLLRSALTAQRSSARKDPPSPLELEDAGVRAGLLSMPPTGTTGDKANVRIGGRRGKFRSVSDWALLRAIAERNVADRSLCDALDRFMVAIGVLDSSDSNARPESLSDAPPVRSIFEKRAN